MTSCLKHLATLEVCGQILAVFIPNGIEFFTNEFKTRNNSKRFLAVSAYSQDQRPKRFRVTVVLNFNTLLYSITTRYVLIDFQKNVLPAVKIIQ